MKKALLITLGVIVFLFTTLLVAPILFKDKIGAMIDEQIHKNINATVVFDVKKIDISLIRNFPNVSIGIRDFALIGKVKEFEGDTLYAASSTRFVVDVKSLFSDKIEVRGVYLDEPLIFTKFTKDGKMSWDIAMPSDEEVQEQPADTSAFNIAIDEWVISKGRVIYEDEGMPMFAEIKGLDHRGSGDLSKDIFEMDTKTHIASMNLVYDGVKYFHNTLLEGDMKMNMDMNKMEFRFMDNEYRLNNFVFGFEGLVGMPGDDMLFDIKFDARKTDFKNLISLVPAVFMKDYEKLETSGKIAFNGWYKGLMTDTQMPGYGLNMKVDDGYMKYPDLPNSIKNVKMDLAVANADGNTQSTIIDLKEFHMDFGKDPIDIRAYVEGFDPAKIDADVKATIDLADVTKIYPLEDMTLKGIFSIVLNAKGTYSETQMPSVNALMSMKNGFVRTKDVPEPLEAINFTASIINEDGALANTIVDLKDFNMRFQNEPFFMKAHVENLDDPHYDVTMKGILDLTKLTSIYPLDDMTLGGRIDLDLQTKGTMSDVNAGNYMKTSSSGRMGVKNFTYTSNDFPQGMKLSEAIFSLTPDKAMIEKMKGHVGKSDIDIQGFVSNYMGYMFGTQDTTIRGKMTFRSNVFDANEWMTEEEETAATTTEDEGIFIVPGNVDFVLSSAINKVIYSNMDITDLAGDIIVRDGMMRMDKVGFKTLGGGIVMNGTYDTKEPAKPKFDMSLNIDKVKIKEAYSTFNTVQSFAPVAQNMEGDFSSLMKMSGDLGQDMSPVMNTVNGKGTVQLASASLASNNMLQNVQNVSKVNLLPVNLKDLLLQFEIKDGKIFIDPFDLNAGNIKMNVGGNQSIDGLLDYIVKLDVPAGAAGEAFNNNLSKLTGKASDNPQNVKLDLKVGGTFDKPAVSLVGSSVKEQAKEAVKDAVKNRAKEELNNNSDVQRAKEEAERTRMELEQRKKDEEERIRREIEDKKRAEEERLKKEAEQKAREAGKDLLKKSPLGR